MRIYTGSGDGGETGLFKGGRVPKEDPRIQAFGTIDELNSLLGCLRAEGIEADMAAGIVEIQRDLFEVGSDLATPGGTRCERLLPPRITALEAWMDRLSETLPPLRNFVLPGGARSACLAQVARAVCRRAERLAWGVARRHPLPKPLLVYLNRLSDLLFLIARAENARLGVAEIPWNPSGA